jgi:hypothetical protein
VNGRPGCGTGRLQMSARAVPCEAPAIKRNIVNGWMEPAGSSARSNCEGIASAEFHLLISVTFSTPHIGYAVKSHSSIDRFLVVFHSPTGMAETGLLACRSEKTGRASWCNANTMDFL